jgi:hypothetical protein
MLDVNLVVYRSVFLHTKLWLLGWGPVFASLEGVNQACPGLRQRSIRLRVRCAKFGSKTRETHAAVCENDARDMIAGRDRNCGWMMENHTLENDESICMSDRRSLFIFDRDASTVAPHVMSPTCRFRFRSQSHACMTWNYTISLPSFNIRNIVICDEISSAKAYCISSKFTQSSHRPCFISFISTGLWWRSKTSRLYASRHPAENY